MVQPSSPPHKRPSSAVVPVAVSASEADTSATATTNTSSEKVLPTSLPLSSGKLPSSSSENKEQCESTPSSSAPPTTTAFVASISRMLLVICVANLMAVACLVTLDATADDTLDIYSHFSHRRGLSLSSTEDQPQHSFLRLQNEWKPSVLTGEEFQVKRSAQPPKSICPDAERYFDAKELKESVDAIEEFYKTLATNTDAKATMKSASTMFGPKGPNCTQLTKYTGGSVCLPHTNKQEKADGGELEECHIIRSGGGDNWNWEQQILSVLPQPQKCMAHKADCGIANVPNKPVNSPNMHFYNHCLSDHFHMDGQGRYHVLYLDLLELAELGPAARPLLLKLDAPADVWTVLPEMMKQDFKLTAMKLPTSLPQQVLLEVDPHHKEIMNWMQQMFTDGGYVPIAQKPSMKCPTCYQLLFFQVMC